MITAIVCFIGILVGAVLFALGVADEQPLWFLLGSLFTVLSVLVGLGGGTTTRA